jgi:choline transport protein
MADIYHMKRSNGGQAMVSEAASRSSGEVDANGEKPYVDRDDREMAYLGKKQQLKRNFGFMSMLGFSCTLMITWEGLFSVFVFGLEDGGPAGLIYGYIFCWIGYAAVVASLAEMVSM